jgi:hypothetical protein
MGRVIACRPLHLLPVPVFDYADNFVSSRKRLYQVYAFGKMCRLASLIVAHSRFPNEQGGRQIHSLQSCTPTEQMLYLSLGEPEMRLTKERIFRAGVVQGLLMREEQNWYQMLNTWPETKRVIEKSVWKEFAKKIPRLPLNIGKPFAFCSTENECEQWNQPNQQSQPMTTTRICGCLRVI